MLVSLAEFKIFSVNKASLFIPRCFVSFIEAEARERQRIKLGINYVCFHTHGSLQIKDFASFLQYYSLCFPCSWTCFVLVTFKTNVRLLYKACRNMYHPHATIYPFYFFNRLFHFISSHSVNGGGKSLANIKSAFEKLIRRRG